MIKHPQLVIHEESSSIPVVEQEVGQHNNSSTNNNDTDDDDDDDKNGNIEDGDDGNGNDMRVFSSGGSALIRYKSASSSMPSMAADKHGQPHPIAATDASNYLSQLHPHLPFHNSHYDYANNNSAIEISTVTSPIHINGNINNITDPCTNSPKVPTESSAAIDRSSTDRELLLTSNVLGSGSPFRSSSNSSTPSSSFSSRMINEASNLAMNSNPNFLNHHHELLMRHGSSPPSFLNMYHNASNNINQAVTASHPRDSSLSNPINACATPSSSNTSNSDREELAADNYNNIHSHNTHDQRANLVNNSTACQPSEMLAPSYDNNFNGGSKYTNTIATTSAYSWDEAVRNVMELTPISTATHHHGPFISDINDHTLNHHDNVIPYDTKRLRSSPGKYNYYAGPDNILAADILHHHQDLSSSASIDGASILKPGLDVVGHIACGNLVSNNHVTSHHAAAGGCISPTTSPDNYNIYSINDNSVPCRARAKRGCATHPRSIAERVRRTKISERMKKLQDLVPNMDKQTNTAEMLDEAVEYVKGLQRQLKEQFDA